MLACRQKGRNPKLRADGNLNHPLRKERRMKKIGLLICLLAALAMCANAQTLIDFSDLPAVANPIALPENYPSGSYLMWSNFYYPLEACC
jgi:hypothetical protein